LHHFNQEDEIVRCRADHSTVTPALTAGTNRRQSVRTANVKAINNSASNSVVTWPVRPQRRLGFVIVGGQIGFHVTIGERRPAISHRGITRRRIQKERKKIVRITKQRKLGKKS
jgi:hypothetical protein